MIIFKDAISNDELFSDTYKYEIVQGCMYRVEGKLTSESTDVDDSMFGGNASAEGGGDDYGSEAVSGINVVLAHKLTTTNFTKATYKTHIKDYMKRVKAHLEAKGNADDVAAFMKNAAKVVGDFILKNFGDFEFYIGESMDADGMVILCRWEEDETVPVLYFFKDGVDAEKV